MEQTAFFSSNLNNDRYWRGFRQGDWCHLIAVRDFIVRNVSPYEGNENFLVGPSKRTKAVWEKLQPYSRRNKRKACLPWMQGRLRHCLRIKPDISTAITR